jgi:hypothetical protein
MLAAAAGAERPDALVAELVLIYDGALASFAREVADPIQPARRLATHAVSRHLAPSSAS